MVELNHISIIVSNEECLKFYNALGFIETKRINRNNDVVVFMECGNMVLETFIDDNHPERVTNPEAKGLRHIALTVDNFDSYIKNIKHEEIRTNWFGKRFTFCKDLDGLPVEIVEK